MLSYDTSNDALLEQVISQSCIPREIESLLRSMNGTVIDVMLKQTFESHQLILDNRGFVVDGPSYQTLKYMLEIAGVSSAQVDMILTYVYRKWKFAFILNQYDLARTIILNDLGERRNYDKCSTQWERRKLFPGKFLWSWVRKRLLIRSIVFYIFGLMQQRLCAEDGVERLRDLNNYESFVNSNM